VTARLLSTKKLRWLFAETLVIVLGVLIALGLDDYRTNQYERRLAIDYVQRIQDDLIRDLDYIERIWVQRLKIKRESLEAIAPVIRGQTQAPADVEGFLKQVARGGIAGTSAASWYTDTTFQDMRATGNLRLIQDPDIRAQISRYYEAVQSEALRVEARFTNYAPFVHAVLPAELRDDIDLDALEAFGTDYALERLLTDDFRDLLNQEYNLMLFLESREYQVFAQSLFDELEAYRIELEDG
jgi:hypothetical protein